MLNFGICKLHSAQFINFFNDKINYFVLYTIRCRSYSKIILILFLLIFHLLDFRDSRWLGHNLLFQLKNQIKLLKKSLIVIKFFSLIRYKCRKLKSHLIKSYFIKIKKYVCLTHQHIVQLSRRQLFWVPQPYHQPAAKCLFYKRIFKNSFWIC
jgi:hypothetical protein